MKKNKKILRIGVDARSLSVPITGIGRYTFDMLSSITKLGHEWFLYSNVPLLKSINTDNVYDKSNFFPGRILRMIWAQFFLPYLLYRDSIDIFWSPSHRLPLLISKKIARVITIHDLVWKFAPNTMRPFSRFLDMVLMPASIKISDHVIAVSNHTASCIIDEVPNINNKVTVIYHGLQQNLHSLSLNDISFKFKIPYSFILFVGTLEPRKNLYRLLKAYSNLSLPIKNNVSIVIVGGKGWGNVDVNSIITELKISSNVLVFGYVSDSELALLYRKALFLAFPSIYEGFGFPLIESMSFGLPVLTSNRSSMPEIIGNAGYLVNPFDINSIQFGLLQLITNKTLRDKLSLQSIQRAKLFSWDISSRELFKIIEFCYYQRQSLIT